MSTRSRQYSPSRPLTSLQEAFDLSIARWTRKLRPLLAQLREAERRTILAGNDLGWTLLASILSLTYAGVSPSEGAWPCALLTLVTLASLYSFDQYTLEPHTDRSVIKALGFGTASSLATVWIQGASMVLFPTMGLCACLALLGIVFSRPLWTRLFTSPLACRRTLLVCSPPEAAQVLAEIERHPQCGLQAVGMVADADPQSPEASLQGNPEQVGAMAEACHADQILAGPSALHAPQWQQTLPISEETFDLASLFERLSHRVPVRLIDERWFIECFQWGRGLGYRVAKRLVDLAFSLLGLLAAAPLIPVIALAIKLNDRGPLLYSQERVGLEGRLFRVYKFRTMRMDAEKDGAVWAKQNDDRVTRTGRFLRRTRLDEIPQLWNVLVGEMSLVGPRPERPQFVEELAAAIPHYHRRHLVPPGLTGWAQVRYSYGSSVEDAEEKLKFDLYYLKHRSVAFDLLILLRTVSVVLNKTGSR